MTAARRANRAALGAFALASAATLTACSPASSGTSTPDSEAAEKWPEAGTTIEWIVPSAAGGGNDILARILAPVLSEELDATVQVVNREGGNQVIGLTEVANADPDGTTMGFTNIPSILGRYLDPSKQATFDRESFAPIGSFASNDIIIAVPKDSPSKSLEDLFEAIDDDPGAVTAGTDSRAGDDHINLATLEQELDLDMNVVHYDSGSDKVAALVSGELDMALGGVSSFFGPWQSGDIELLAVVADERSPFAPDVPTLAEAGYEGIAPMTSRFTVSVPTGTPENIMAALESALETAATDPEVIEQLEGAATKADFLSGQDAADLWAEREETIAPIIADLLVQQ